MPNIDTIQDATPRCPGTSTNVNYGLGRVMNTGNNQRLHCGKAMRWDQDGEHWTCGDGHSLSGESVAAVAADTLAAAA